MKKLIPTILFASQAFSVALAHDSAPRQVSVSGQCQRQVAPDRGSITLTAQFRDDDLKTAIKRTTDAYERAREGVQRLKLDDLELNTAEYQVYQVQEWENNRSVMKGYQARMGLRVVTSSIARIGEVIAVAAKENIRETGQLATFLSQAKLKSEQEACLEIAAKNARARAQKLAEALDAKLGSVQQLSESWNSFPQPVPMPIMARGAVAMDKAEVSAPTVEAGKQDLSVTVSAAFELK